MENKRDRETRGIGDERENKGKRMRELCWSVDGDALPCGFATGAGTQVQYNDLPSLFPFSINSLFPL